MKENQVPSSYPIKQQELSVDLPLRPRHVPEPRVALGEEQRDPHGNIGSYSKDQVTSSTVSAPHIPAEKDTIDIVRRQKPSTFAQTLFKSAPEESTEYRREMFAMPYTASSVFQASVFSKPSPDDVVLAAQSQGSKFGKVK